MTGVSAMMISDFYLPKSFLKNLAMVCKMDPGGVVVPGGGV